MEHCDPETLALTAMGEAPATDAQSAHLSACALCRAELDALRQTVSVARSTLGEGALSTPSGAVWSAIHRELGLAAGIRPPLEQSADTASAHDAPTRAEHSAPAAGAADAGHRESSAPHAPVASLADARRRRGALRSLVVPVAASAAAAALVAGGILWWGAAEPVDPAITVASADLDALPDWQGAAGSALVLQRGDDRVVTVTVDAPAPDGALREVWLLTPEVDGLISLGFLDGTSDEFRIPAGVDLAEYPIVDVSQEPLDGDPAHSGDSVVRGTLDV